MESTQRKGDDSEATGGERSAESTHRRETTAKRRYSVCHTGGHVRPPAHHRRPPRRRRQAAAGGRRAGLRRLPARHPHAVEVGFAVVGFDVSTTSGSRPCVGAELSTSATSPPTNSAKRSPGAVLCGQRTLPTFAGFDVAVITVPTPLRDGAARPLATSRSGRDALAPYLRPGALRRPRVDDLSGHHRGAGRARSSRRARACVAGVDFYLGYSPERIDPGNRDVDASRTRRRSCRASTPTSLRRGRRRFYDTLVEQTVPVASTARGRAHQAAREHVPPRQHRAGQRAGDVRRRPRHRHLGGDRRRVDQAVRLHALHARSRRRRPLPARSTRPTCRGGCERPLGHAFRFVELANDVNEHMPDYVVRRVVALLNDAARGR